MQSANKIAEISESSILVSEEICKAAAGLAPKETESQDVSGKILAMDVSEVYVCIIAMPKLPITMKKMNF